MRIALVDPVPSKTVYSVALLKLGAMLRAQGHDVVLHSGRLPEAGAADAIWITTVFTFDIPKALGFCVEARRRAPEVRVGGVAATLLPERFEKHGFEVYRGLMAEAEEMAPDYTLLSTLPDYSITHTSRGCIRKCAFCMVTRVEPDFVPRDWERDLCPGAGKILFYDNNWLAKDFDEWLRDVAIINRLVSSGAVRGIDFNQGLDCRLLTPERADAMRGLPIKPLRFAFDGPQEDGHLQRAIERMASFGFRDFGVYVLYNFMDRPGYLYYRLRECTRLGESLRVSVAAFPMRYQPILEADTSREYVGRHWTAQQRKGFMALYSKQSVSGQVSQNSIADFEYWFGKTEAEFLALLSYTDIRELAAKRKGAQRWRAAQERAGKLNGSE